MNSDTPSKRIDPDEPGLLLRETIAHICAVPAPQQAMMRLLTQAAAWPDADHQSRSPWLPRFAAVAAVLAIALGTLIYWIDHRTPGSTSPRTIALVPTQPTTPRGGTAVPSSQSSRGVGGVPMGLDPIAADGASGRFGGTAAPRGGMAGAWASRYMAIADDAPVIVSTGSDQPIRLGDKESYSSKDFFLHVWDWSKSQASRPLKIAYGSALAVTPDGKSIVTRDGQLIDAATGEARRLDNFGGQVGGMQFSRDGRALLLQVNDKNYVATMRLLDFPACTRRTEIPGQWGYTFACAFTPDGGQVLTMDKDRILRRWDAMTGKELAHYDPAFENSIRAITVSSDGVLIAGAGTRGEIYVWELVSGKMLRKLVAQQGPDLTVLSGSGSLAFSPDAKFILGGSGFRIVVWETNTGKVTRLLPYASGGVVNMRFSPDGKKVTTVRDFHGHRDAAGNEARVFPQVQEWDLETAKEINQGPQAPKPEAR